jgi:hypothetical protein
LILDSLLDVEGKWDSLEQIPSCERVVLFQIMEESLLVAQVKVVHEMVVHTAFERGKSFDFEAIQLLGKCSILKLRGHLLVLFYLVLCE